MNWRHKAGLERFARASRPLTFHDTPGVGEASWKVFLAKAWLEPSDDSNKKWWQRPHRLTDAGRAALAETS